MKARILIFAAAFVWATGCSVGPDYRRPPALVSTPLPSAWEEAAGGKSVGMWKTAEPSAHLPRGEWWKIFGQAELDRLEQLAAARNQNLAAAAARLEQARALVGAARSDFFPQLSAQPSVTRQRTSANAPVNGKPAGVAYTENTFFAPLDLSWEVDLWGRVRRSAEGAQARWAAAGDDFESAKLSLQAEVANDFFLLQALERERGLVAETITAYQRSLELTQNRRKGGIVSDLDVSQAETQLRVTEAELPALDLQRETLRHALAELCGQTARDFQLAFGDFRNDAAVPDVPAGLPSELLERRPDIAASERLMKAANADVGVAKSAFYPRILLTGMAGFQSWTADAFFDWPSRVWAVGPSVNFPLFTGGRNRSRLAAARASYDETVAHYRATVLAAFREVEDSLSAQRLLASQYSAQSAGLAAARHTLEIANNRYRAGLTTYLEVASAQNTALSAERAVVHLAGQRLDTEVTLIKALGGGWVANH